MKNFFLKAWYHSGNNVLWYLYPFTLLYQFLSTSRKTLYDWGILTKPLMPVPLIVVGNISVGGTGKTPLVIELVNYLKKQGFKPGVVSRGYGGSANMFPFLVNSSSDVAETGDEPMLIYKRTQVPIVIDPKRSRGARSLVFDAHCDVIVSDDGLQHYALDRHFEIVVIDGQRMFGNEQLLPAGPLREKKERIKDFELVVINGKTSSAMQYVNGLADQNAIVGMKLKAGFLENITGSVIGGFTDLNVKVHAVAGIGNPERFFDTLRHMGFDIIPHAFADHHDFKEKDLVFSEDLPIIMTEKDAVKCIGFNFKDLWFLPVHAELENEFYQSIDRFMNIK